MCVVRIKHNLTALLILYPKLLNNVDFPLEQTNKWLHLGEW